MSMTELESKVNDLRELRRMADEVAAEITAIEDDLKSYMTANNADELHGFTFRITWKPVTSSPGAVGTVHQNHHFPAVRPGSIRKAPYLSSRPKQ